MRALTGPRDCLRGLSAWFLAIAAFSASVNILMLAGPLYMLQVYDRVLTSRSEATLVALTGLVAGLFLIMGVLDHARARVAARIGAIFQSRMDPLVLEAGLGQAASAGVRTAGAAAIRDSETVRTFFTSPVLFSLCDAPWAPVFIFAIFVFHPYLGWFAVAGSLLLVVVTLLNQWAARRPEGAALAEARASDSFAESLRGGAETVQALGMTRSACERWQKMREGSLKAQMRSSDRVGAFSSAVKSLRFFLQSAVLGFGAWLAIQGEISAGAIVAASILLGRALAPIEQAIGGWPLVLRARRAWTGLGTLLTEVGRAPQPMPLPKPRAHLVVDHVTVLPPDSRKTSLRTLSFRLEPGQALGVIGMSAAGKTSLARLLTGIWPPLAGHVRLDGATLDQYGADALGHHIGYLPQDVVLFEGTVAENICRLQADPDPNAVVVAAKKAGAHEMILELPDGYDTHVAAGGARLSGGQRQRIALARALYGNPVLLVLDEPNAHLDAPGSDALNAAVRSAKAEGKAVVLMAHRPTGIAECDLILVLENGTARAFGPRDEVLRAQVRNYAQVAGRIKAEARG